MKLCGTCKQTKSDSEFAYKSKATGVLQGNCRLCQKAYRKAHYEANRQRYCDKASRLRDQYKKEFYMWLQTQHCTDCGKNDFRFLELDHLRDKEFCIAEMIGVRTLASLQDEIAKCDVVCSNCHKIRTAERGGFYKFMGI